MCNQSAAGTAKPTIHVENERTRVTEWRFPKRGANTGWHTHEHDYLVVPLFDGNLEIEMPDGLRVVASLQNGVPYYRDLGVKHDVCSGNDFECAFIEIEFLERRR